MIKKFIFLTKKTAFVVEHDFIMATYLADRVVLFEGENWLALIIIKKGQPAVSCTALPPQGLVTGMNRFLQMLDITLRRDPTNFRPRINQHNSRCDKEQKASGVYFHCEID